MLLISFYTSISDLLENMTVNGVADLITEKGCGKYAEKFQAEGIDGRVLQLLDEEDLKTMAIPREPREKILKAITEAV